MAVRVTADLITGLQDSAPSDGPFAKLGGWLVGALEEQSIFSSFNALVSPGQCASADIAADLGACMLVRHILEEASLPSHSRNNSQYVSTSLAPSIQGLPHRLASF